MGRARLSTQVQRTGTPERSPQDGFRRGNSGHRKNTARLLVAAVFPFHIYKKDEAVLREQGGLWWCAPASGRAAAGALVRSHERCSLRTSLGSVNRTRSGDQDRPVSPWFGSPGSRYGQWSEFLQEVAWIQPHELCQSTLCCSERNASAI